MYQAFLEKLELPYNFRMYSDKIYLSAHVNYISKIAQYHIKLFLTPSLQKKFLTQLTRMKF